MAQKLPFSVEARIGSKKLQRKCRSRVAKKYCKSDIVSIHAPILGLKIDFIIGRAIAGDVRKSSDVEEAVKRTMERFGRIDYLVCGAAGNFLAPVDKLSYNAFRTVIEIDLLGTYNLTKVF